MNYLRFFITLKLNFWAQSWSLNNTPSPLIFFQIRKGGLFTISCSYAYLRLDKVRLGLLHMVRERGLDRAPQGRSHMQDFP